jgi:hypothetical protein
VGPVRNTKKGRHTNPSRVSAASSSRANPFVLNSTNQKALRNPQGFSETAVPSSVVSIQGDNRGRRPGGEAWAGKTRQDANKAAWRQFENKESWKDWQGTKHTREDSPPIRRKFDRTDEYYNAIPNGEDGFNYSYNPVTVNQQVETRRVQAKKCHVKEQAAWQAVKKQVKQNKQSWNDKQGDEHRAESPVLLDKFMRRRKYAIAVPDESGSYTYDSKPPATSGSESES